MTLSLFLQRRSRLHSVDLDPWSWIGRTKQRANPTSLPKVLQSLLDYFASRKYCTIIGLLTGYCFLLFQDEMSVQALIEACLVEDSKLYWCVSSPTMKDKPVSKFYLQQHQQQQSVNPSFTALSQVQIRPWNLADSDFVKDGSQPLDPRKTIFVGGVPRPLRAREWHPFKPPDDFECPNEAFDTGRWAGHDHEPALWRRVLCGHRHWPRAQVPQRGRTCGLCQSTELHRSHQRSICAAAAWRHRQEGQSYTWLTLPIECWPPSLFIHRWRWSRTCWMTSCVMNAKEPAAEANLRPSSARTSPACSTTASTAGPRSTHDLDENSTSRWSKKGLTAHEPCPSAGAESLAGEKADARVVAECDVSPLVPHMIT